MSTLLHRPASSQLLRPWLVRIALPLSLGLGAAACSFEEAAGNAALTSNTCSNDGDCGPDARCAEAMCVARDVQSGLRVVLEVTPAQQNDGRPPVPFTIDDLTLDAGRMFRAWEQPAPVTVRGRVRNARSAVEADVTLTATVSPPGLLPKVATASVTAFDYELSVAVEGEYILRVQPKDTSLPPLERLVTIEDGDEIVIDYADPEDVEIYELALTLLGASDDRPLVVRAFDSVTGALISSAASVSAGEAVLRFAGKPEGFRLVVRPEGAYDPDGLSSGNDCDHDTPVLPTLSIESSAINVDELESGAQAQLSLPTLPERVPYQGSIELCDAPSANNTAAASLPVTLRSTTVLLDDDLGSWTAEVAADTEASLEAGGIYRFCVDVFQGTYDVVITPPAGQPCEILAEERTVATQDGSPATASLFEMMDAAELAGQVQTHDMMALAAAAVDVKSLGREGAVPLDPELPTLTGYNRSQQATTDESGAFNLSVDRGSYDVTFKPPPGSGYAWYVLRDVTIGSRKRFTNTIDMSSPVAIDCSIAYEGGGATLAGAEITAFAVVSDSTLPDRAIPIGKAMADENGSFMLLLPSSVREGW